MKLRTLCTPVARLWRFTTPAALALVLGLILPAPLGASPDQTTDTLVLFGLEREHVIRDIDAAIAASEVFDEGFRRDPRTVAKSHEVLGRYLADGVPKLPEVKRAARQVVTLEMNPEIQDSAAAARADPVATITRFLASDAAAHDWAFRMWLMNQLAEWHWMTGDIDSALAVLIESREATRAMHEHFSECERRGVPVSMEERSAAKFQASSMVQLLANMIREGRLSPAQLETVRNHPVLPRLEPIRCALEGEPDPMTLR